MKPTARTAPFSTYLTLSQRRRPIKWPTLLVYVILTLGSVIMLFPLVWTAFSAFKEPSEIIQYPPTILPEHPTTATIQRIWNEVNFKRYFVNSLFVATVATSSQLLTSSLVGYVLAKYKFRGRNLVFGFILVTMMIPWPVLIIPQYLVAQDLGLLNSYKALILPSLYSSFGIFMMRQFMHSIPDELVDAARIDGANEPQIFYRIVLPLTKPALAALGIFHFMWHWDSFVWPLIVINSEKLYTLPLGLAIFQGQYWTDYAAVNAGTLISVIPVLLVFLVLQRRFIEGIALTGLKG